MMTTTTMMVMNLFIFMAVLLWTPTDAVFDVVVTWAHTCALYGGEGIRCWGYNEWGQLGLGSQTRYYEPQDNVIDFGTGFEPKEVRCGQRHCCTLSTAGTLKCWGDNFAGFLGYGDTKFRGDDADEMGDYLEEVELPTGFVAEHIYTP